MGDAAATRVGTTEQPSSIKTCIVSETCVASYYYQYCHTYDSTRNSAYLRCCAMVVVLIREKRPKHLTIKGDTPETIRNKYTLGITEPLKELG